MVVDWRIMSSELMYRNGSDSAETYLQQASYQLKKKKLNAALTWRRKTLKLQVHLRCRRQLFEHS